MKHDAKRRPPTQAGFTLLEVLVALLVLSLGLLGLAALQTIGLKYNNQSYQRTQAVLQAYDAIDRIRANKSDDATVNSTYDDVALGAEPTGPDCTSTSCSPTDMANYDIRSWNVANAGLLSQGQGAICRGTLDPNFNCTVSGQIYDVAIVWQENNVPLRIDVETQP